MSTFAGRVSVPLLDLAGNALPGVEVRIRRRADQVLATIYSSRTKAVLTNPLPTGVTPGAAGLDSAGNATFYADAEVDLEAAVTANGITFVVPLPGTPLDAAELADPIRATITRGETFPRRAHAVSSGAGFITSGTAILALLHIPTADPITTLSALAGTTGLTRGTNGDSHVWFGLCDLNRNLLARTADDIASAWAANLELALAVAAVASGPAASYTPTPGLHYFAIVVNAGTGGAPATPQLFGPSGLGATFGQPPVLAFNSDAALGAPPAFPFTFTLGASRSVLPYCRARG